MADFDKKHEIITELGIRYSAGTDDLLKKIYAREHKIQSAKEELDILRRSVIASRVSEIKADIAAAPAPTIHIYKYSDMKADDLRRIGESAMEETSGVVIIVSESDSTILLFSDGR